MEKGKHRESIPLAVLLGGLSAASFAAMSAALKAAKLEGATLGQQVFFRSAVTAVSAAIAVRAMGLTLRGLPVRILLLRTLFGGSAMAIGFWALSQPGLPLGDAEILRRTSPVFVVLLGWPLLGERPTASLLALLALAFVGTVLVVGPSFEIAGAAGIAGLISGALGAGAYLAIRHLVQRMPATIVILFFTGTMTLVSAPFALAHPLPAGPMLWLLLAAGLGGTLGQVCMTNAYRFASAGIVSTTGYLAVVFATAFGVLLFDRMPGATSVLGATLIVVSCVLISRHRPTGGRGGMDGVPPRGNRDGRTASKEADP